MCDFVYIVCNCSDLWKLYWTLLFLLGCICFWRRIYCCFNLTFIMYILGSDAVTVQMVKLVNADMLDFVWGLLIKWEDSKVTPLFFANKDKFLQILVHLCAWIWKSHGKYEPALICKIFEGMWLSDMNCQCNLWRSGSIY